MSDQAAAAFDALGDPSRRRIVELFRDGPTPVGALADRLPIGRPAVSKHLKVLSDAGLTEHRTVGTSILHATSRRDRDGTPLVDRKLGRGPRLLCRGRPGAITAPRSADAHEPRRHHVSDLPPIRREVVVDLDPDRAFELFTAY